jgi:hypothetical protein
MNINTIKKFLEETKFKAVNYRTFTWSHDLYHYELFEFMTEDGQTLGIALHKSGFCGKISIYKNNKFVVCFNNLINKWSLHSYIKKAFSKHFDEVIENWKKEEKK